VSSNIGWWPFKDANYENLINYNLNKINKISNRLNKRISSIVNVYNRIKDKVLWCKLSKKKSWVTQIKIKSDEG